MLIRCAPFFEIFFFVGERYRELRKVFFDKIPVLAVDDETNAKFAALVEDIQQAYSEEKAAKIDQLLFDLYNLSEEERDSCTRCSLNCDSALL